MSSAILYVAIVAIWAGVLIPRWIRRDTFPSAPSSHAVPSSSEVQDVPVDAEDEPASAPRRRDADGKDRDMQHDQAHRRVLSARRRLLGLLLALTIGSGVLADARLAAWWVIVPPSVMLLGYLLLLREAAKADTERRAADRALALAEAARAARTVRAARPPVPVPVAEVITFSASRAPGGRDDQIYDQYADAKLRAVGD